jgi:carbon starvation protein
MSAAFGKKSSLQTKLLWTAVVILGVVSFGIVALNRGESVNAAWLVVAAVCVYFVAYRFYGLLVANRALGVDGERPTPAHRHNDGLDYVPTNLYVLYGHHFAAIAGAGPLVGPVLAAQMGYLPGTLWILVGAVFAGAVQDMTVLFISTRCRHWYSSDLCHRACSSRSCCRQSVGRQSLGNICSVLHDPNCCFHGCL